jgi:hypothetical protein
MPGPKHAKRVTGTSGMCLFAEKPGAEARARKLVDGSKFTGRRPELSENVEGSSTGCSKIRARNGRHFDRFSRQNALARPQRPPGGQLVEMGQGPSTSWSKSSREACEPWLRPFNMTLAFSTLHWYNCTTTLNRGLGFSVGLGSGRPVL